MPGLPMPDSAARDEVGDGEYSSEQFRMGRLKAKIRARAKEDAEKDAKDVDNIGEHDSSERCPDELHARACGVTAGDG